MLQRFADANGLALDAAIDRFAAESGIARYGAPEDVAAAIAFLVSPPVTLSKSITASYALPALIHSLSVWRFVSPTSV
jgi:3-oxoacyl-[acyl-carrier protein] reductase